MSLTESEQITRNIYDTFAEDWAATHHQGNFWEAEMSTFKAHLPWGRILEIGAGGGRDATELIRRGYDYVGTDVSASLLTIARRENPSAQFHLQSVYELNFSKEPFDGFWAFAVLLHVPKIRIDEALQQIKGCVNRGGIGFISLKEGTGEEIITERTRAGNELKRLFSFYNQQEFITILRRNGFLSLDDAKKENSRLVTWLTYIVCVG